MSETNIKISDRILSAGTYITGGFVGVIWQIICAIRRVPTSRFLMFNIYQSVFLSLLIFIINLLASFVIKMLIIIPIINKLVNMVILGLYSPIYYNWSIIGLFILSVYIYLAVFSIMGKYPYIPWVSKIISENIDRY